jgi:hypothetical protein
MRGNKEVAIRLFRDEVSSESGNREAYSDLVYLLIEKELDEALKFAQKAVEMAPGHPASSGMLG